MEQYEPGRSEIGSLTAHSNEDSQFVGSSSGVYFINTVKRAFSTGLEPSGSPETDFPTAEETIVGVDDSPRPKRRCTQRHELASSVGGSETPPHWRYDPAMATLLGTAPPLDLAKELMMMYFKVWHPLFPFLHGPTFLQVMERLYSHSDREQPTDAPSPDHRSTCWTVTLQCIFNMGYLLRPDLPLPPDARIQSPGKMVSLLGTFATRHDIASLQALLAVQVYLVATMSLRLASIFGGCVLRSMLHAGLHRCPFRYAQLSSHDRQLRKRIFWCAYAIDRYLSQALGLPLGIQDSDIDVCLPAAVEMHSPRRFQDSNSNLAAERVRGSLGNESWASGDPPVESLDIPTDQRGKEGILASYVDSGTLTGRALELFHKSILVRSVRRNSVLFLVTDVHKWWNNLPPDLQGKPPQSEDETKIAEADKVFDFGPFFTVLYQHLILIIHRPSLSLDPSTAEFCSGLQTCIGASRGIIAALRLQVNSRQALFWPGFLSAATSDASSRLIETKSDREINECLDFLKKMSGQWETARHCQMALSWLFTKIGQGKNESVGLSNSHSYAMDTPRGSISLDLLGARRQGLRVSQVAEHEDSQTQRPGNVLEGFKSPQLDPSPRSPRHAFPGENLPVGSSLDVDSIDPTQPYAGSNFDLNMADLLHGANFDSLFDMVGQQYPGF
ncbi:hypothetical protein N7492_000941 [Penicillium capsulatum]|uniref:Xylanolytic transcriptional activator regulatory domain-containing protein n=1 Tax=Penicillium capsulatum TaxID=69766 RepID=A0A9W9LZG4_9EURO|nr:hypothetical protein N7492_000941 [Penicillium capsulatum]KAJ6130002.1 hypothetical protein N7512_002782 [Penicillium capsulatum]